MFGQRKRNGGIPQPSSQEKIPRSMPIRVCLCLNGRDLNRSTRIGQGRSLLGSAAATIGSIRRGAIDHDEKPGLKIAQDAARPTAKQNPGQSLTPRQRHPPRNALSRATSIARASASITFRASSITPGSTCRRLASAGSAQRTKPKLPDGGRRSANAERPPFRDTRPDLAPLSTRTGIVRIHATLLV